MYFVFTKLFFVDDEFQDSIIRNLKFNICSFIHLLIQIYTEHLLYVRHYVQPSGLKGKQEITTTLRSSQYWDKLGNARALMKSGQVQPQKCIRGINVALGRSMTQLGAGLGSVAEEATDNLRCTGSVRESAEGIGRLLSQGRVTGEKQPGARMSKEENRWAVPSPIIGSGRRGRRR